MLPERAPSFIYGMLGANHLKARYAGVTHLYKHLETALKNLYALYIIAAIQNIEALVYHLKVEIATCAHMSEDAQTIETWAEVSQQPKSLAATIAKHYLPYKRAEKADISAVPRLATGLNQQVLVIHWQGRRGPHHCPRWPQ